MHYFLKVVLLLFLNFYSYISFADANDTSDRQLRFTPHITSEAWTQKQWGFNFRRAVGSNINTNVLLSSLTVALTNRFEIGTTPFFYLEEEHLGNISLKYNFWRTKCYLWSVGFNAGGYKLEDEEGNALEEELRLFSLQLLLNYLPDWTDLKFGVNLNFVEAYISNLNGVEENTLGLDAKWEFGVDMSAPFRKDYEFTLGFGWLRESGITALEEVEFGFGISGRWYRPNKFISSPTLGLHYSPASSNIAFLISTSFF